MAPPSLLYYVILFRALCLVTRSFTTPPSATHLARRTPVPSTLTFLIYYDTRGLVRLLDQVQDINPYCRESLHICINTFGRTGT